MLCEGRLWSVIYGEGEETCQEDVPSAAAHASADAFRQGLNSKQHDFTEGKEERFMDLQAVVKSSCKRDALTHVKTFFIEHSSSLGPLKSPEASGHQDISSLQSLELARAWPDRQISSEMEIPAQGNSAKDGPFLVPSYCQSICQNYSDLHIAGDQVLPLSANVGEFCPKQLKTAGPLLHSYDVLPPLDQSPQGGPFFPVKQGSHQWRQGSGRDRSFFLQGREGPFSNSLLNHYLEQKLQDLYQQYMMENMAKEDAHSGPMCPLLGSELVLTSLDQITLQLSKEGNLEAGVAKDMVLSCLLRVAGDMQSSEISTPFLQISDEGTSSTEKKANE